MVDKQVILHLNFTPANTERHERMVQKKKNNIGKIIVFSFESNDNSNITNLDVTGEIFMQSSNNWQWVDASLQWWLYMIVRVRGNSGWLRQRRSTHSVSIGHTIRLGPRSEHTNNSLDQVIKKTNKLET